MYGSGPGVKALGKSGETRGVFEAGNNGSLEQTREQDPKRDRSCMGLGAGVQHSTLAATRRPEEMHYYSAKGAQDVYCTR